MIMFDAVEESVTGFPSARIWPFVRPVDGVASNSYVLSAGSLFMVIDPGADTAQTRRIFDLLEQKRAPSAPPVLLLLTHCHRDHSLDVAQWPAQGPPFQVLAHESGAAAFESGNPNATLAFLYDETAPVVAVSIPLSFSSPPGQNSALRLSEQVTLDLVTDVIILPSGPETKCLRLNPGGDACLEIYHAPGHSPDSLFFLFGGLLFTGDILFADKPGVAGIPGWSRSCLLNSLDLLEWLIRTRNISRCCPGHGPMVLAADVLGLIAAAKKNTTRMQKLICLDADRVDFLRSCARAFVYEAGQLLSILGGRLYLLSERLSQLEERQLAEALVNGIGLEQMERFIGDFLEFSEFPADTPLRMDLPLKAVHIIGRIRRVLGQNRLPEGVADVLLQRVEWLLRDYISIATGLDLREHLVKADIRDIFWQARGAFMPFDWSLDAGGRAAEDPEAFAVFLARALDFRLRLPAVETMDPESTAGFYADTDPLRLKLLFIDVLEQLTVRKPGAIRVTFENSAAHLVITFSIETDADSLLMPAKTTYYTAMARLLGGDFGTRKADGRFHVRFMAPLAEAQNQREPRE